MSAAAPAISPAALRGAEELPAPVSGQRHEIGSPVGRLTYYSAGPDAPGKFPRCCSFTASMPRPRLMKSGPSTNTIAEAERSTHWSFPVSGIPSEAGASTPCA